MYACRDSDGTDVDGGADERRRGPCLWPRVPRRQARRTDGVLKHTPQLHMCVCVCVCVFVFVCPQPTALALATKITSMSRPVSKLVKQVLRAQCDQSALVV